MIILKRDCLYFKIYFDIYKLIFELRPIIIQLYDKQVTIYTSTN